MAALSKKEANLQVGSSSGSSVSQGRSKAQMCLKRIVDFISTHSSNRSLVHIEFDSEARVGKQKETDMGCGKRGGFDIDLNLRLGICLESENEKKESSAACSGVGSLAFGGDDVDDKSCEGECDSMSKKKERLLLELGDETKEASEITNIQVEQTSSEIETKRTSEGYLDLLVEAARLVSGDLGEEEEEEDDNDVPVVPPSRTGKEKIQKVNDEEWMLDCYFEDISPVVRSKRGRNQVLPYRYRDSVLEPWRKRTTEQRSSRVSGGKHKSNTTK